MSVTGSSLIKIPVARLRVGMFIAKLDISWLDSPFLSHSRLLKKEEEIQALVASGAKNVVIDISKGSAPLEQEQEPSQQKPREQKQQKQSHAPASVPVVAAVAAVAAPQRSIEDLAEHQTSFTQELRTARVLRAKVKRSIEDIHRSLELEMPIRSEELIPLVDSTLESLSRNDQALMSLAHLSRKAQRVADHVFSTFCLTLNLALTLKIPVVQREQLALAALLHEVGWMQLPLNLMGKRTPYTGSENALIAQHPLLVSKLLQKSQLPPLCLRIVAEHHERLDGSGYPQGLRGNEMHELTQLLSVVDVYEERVHQLTDQAGMVPINAMRALYLDAEKGLLDPGVVAAFISTLGVYPATTAVILNTAEKAVVVHNHAEAPLAPVIDIHYDSQGRVLAEPRRVDLHRQSAQESLAINKAIDPRLAGADPARRLIVSEEQLG